MRSRSSSGIRIVRCRRGADAIVAIGTGYGGTGGSGLFGSASWGSAGERSHPASRAEVLGLRLVAGASSTSAGLAPRRLWSSRSASARTCQPIDGENIGGGGSICASSKLADLLVQFRRESGRDIYRLRRLFLSVGGPGAHPTVLRRLVPARYSRLGCTVQQGGDMRGFSRPGRIRTCDHRIRSPVLCPLSYGGVMRDCRGHE